MFFNQYKRIIILAAILAIGAIAYFGVVYLRKPGVPSPTQAPTPPSWGSPYGIEIVGPPVGQYAETRPPLPPDKEALKRKLVAPLGAGGVLTDGPDFRIDYISPDIFQVEIKTTSIDKAKTAALEWFEQKGFTQEDICNLPVAFYLSSEVARQYQGSGLIFRPLPDFCH